MQLDEALLRELDSKFEKDKYVDWVKEQSTVSERVSKGEEQPEIVTSGDAEKILQNKLF